MAVPNIHAVLDSESKTLGSLDEAIGRRLVARNILASNYDIQAIEKPRVFHHSLDSIPEFGGNDANAIPKPGEHWDDPPGGRINVRAIRHNLVCLLGEVFEEFLASRTILLARKRDQSLRNIEADGFHYLVIRGFGQAELGESVVDAGDDSNGRIGQREVEVEQDGFRVPDGSMDHRALDSIHQSRVRLSSTSAFSLSIASPLSIELAAT